MTSKERHEIRYQRRLAKRLAKKQQRIDELGGLSGVMTFDKAFAAGKRCCNGVRWKTSAQNFEMHLFSRTAVNVRNVQKLQWRPMKYRSFMLMERGKIRPIDAPHIMDRQIHKVFTEQILWPLYRPDLIWNNGASIKGKGLSFSQKMLADDLRSFVRKYGRTGSVILLDLKQFFPSIPHSSIFERHKRLLLNDEIRSIADLIVNANRKEVGMPLGVEPSQIEMVAMLSPLDNYIKCQLGMKYMGHYMDDYYILVPPNCDPTLILRKVTAKANSIGMTVSERKTKTLPFGKSFRFCKAKYTITATGAVKTNGDKGSMKRFRRKMKRFRSMIDESQMSYEDLWCSVNSSMAYWKRYNDHGRLLRARRYFYALFGFSPEEYNEFLKRSNRKNGIHSLQEF